MNIMWFIHNHFAFVVNRNLYFDCAMFPLAAFILNRWVIHWPYADLIAIVATQSPLNLI